MTPILDWALPIALFMLALAMGCALIRLLKGVPCPAHWQEVPARR